METRVEVKIAAVVLAAGLSRRMGNANKLLAVLGELPILVRVVDALLASRVDRVLVVVGHEADRVRAALADRNVTFVDNDAYEEGLGASLRAGFSALISQRPDAPDAAFVVLGDMPWIRSEHVNKLISAFEPDSASTICVPVHEHERGHPVLWSACHFAELAQQSGDVGARALLEKYSAAVRSVEVGDAAVLRDIDTAEMLAEARSGRR